ncbi:MAG: UDP-N-acetylmuramoyl-L-alanine--D-glutamate ligase [Treponema sp.]|nr:UDP-N-acetylmuramoyl-L-alanine--D-glutamate ligase [Treponema sp.]
MKTSANSYSGVKAVIMGLGLNGGNIEAAVYLGQRGAELCVTDLRGEKDLAPSIEKLNARVGDSSRIRYVLGSHEIQDFKNADMVIKNPGVRPDSVYLQAAAHIETDLSLFLAENPARLVGVTGSKGKSSISSAIHWILKEWNSSAKNPEAGKKRAYLGGNITLSPLSFLSELNSDDDVVLELSSWQLADLKDRINKKTGEALLKPRAAVISTILPDHQDRYKNMEEYVDDKRNIYRGQKEEDATITGDDSWGKSFRRESRGRPLVYSGLPLAVGTFGGWIEAGHKDTGDKDTGSKDSGSRQNGFGLARLWKGCTEFDGGSFGPGQIVKVVPKDLLVPGNHQKMNLLIAALALLDLGLPSDFIYRNAGNFPGIEHRLEFFYETRGIRFYNDSAATIPEAAAAAVNAFDRPPVLICGGTDKNLDFAPLAQAAAKAGAVILISGTGTEKLKPLLDKIHCRYSGPFNNLDDVLDAAMEKAAVGGAVVLSPGCTSFGMFLNEFDRGKKWKEKVMAREQGTGSKG